MQPIWASSHGANLGKNLYDKSHKSSSRYLQLDSNQSFSRRNSSNLYKVRHILSASMFDTGRVFRLLLTAADIAQNSVFDAA